MRLALCVKMLRLLKHRVKSIFFFKLIIPWCIWLKKIFTSVWRIIMPNDTSDEASDSLESHLRENKSSTVPRLTFNVEESDEYYCCYDSTWEEGEETVHHERKQKNTCRSPTSYRFNSFERAARDMRKYRHDYPDCNQHISNRILQQDDMPNLMFYLGQRNSSPDGVSIEDFHNSWLGDYSKLERVHTYIQWLFPLQEPGMNYQAKELSKAEIKAFLENSEAKQMLLKSYELMLNFYGIELSNEKTGEVQLARNWEERFYNLNRNTHNNLRITRILKCLGTLGFPHYQAPLVHFFLEQILVNGRLDNVKESALNYFIFAVRNKQERRKLVKYAYHHYEPKHEFVWCPKTIQRMFEAEKFPGDGKTTDRKLDDLCLDNDYKSVNCPSEAESGRAGRQSIVARTQESTLSENVHSQFTTNKETRQVSTTARRGHQNYSGGHQAIRPQGPLYPRCRDYNSRSAIPIPDHHRQDLSTPSSPDSNQDSNAEAPSSTDSSQDSNAEAPSGGGQRKRIADETTENKEIKRSKVYAEGTSDHEEGKIKKATVEPAFSEASEVCTNRKSDSGTANDDEQKQVSN